MDYQYVHTINSMNYLALVNMLSVQITPEIRRLVLERLTAMNNELLGFNLRSQIPTPTETNSHGLRSQSMVNRETAGSGVKKDAKEMVHPALVHQSYAPTYQAYNAPTTAPSKPTPEYQSYHAPTPSKPEFNAGISRRSISINLSPPDSPEIDLDDILGEPKGQQPEPDSLDLKLASIKKLHDKIIADKHRRRRERERAK